MRTFSLTLSCSAIRVIGGEERFFKLADALQVHQPIANWEQTELDHYMFCCVFSGYQQSTAVLRSKGAQKSTFRHGILSTYCAEVHRLLDAGYLPDPQEPPAVHALAAGRVAARERACAWMAANKRVYWMPREVAQLVAVEIWNLRFKVPHK